MKLEGVKLWAETQSVSTFPLLLSPSSLSSLFLSFHHSLTRSLISSSLITLSCFISSASSLITLSLLLCSSCFLLLVFHPSSFFSPLVSSVIPSEASFLNHPLQFFLPRCIKCSCKYSFKHSSSFAGGCFTQRWILSVNLFAGHAAGSSITWCWCRDTDVEFGFYVGYFTGWFKYFCW